MPRWLVVALTLIVYAAVMTGLAFIIRETVPTGIDWLDNKLGSGGTWALMLAILIPAAVYGWWPRKPDGTMRRLRSPWD